MLAGWVGRNDCLGASLREPLAQAPCVVGAICEETRGAGHKIEQSTDARKVVRIARGELESAWPSELIRQGMDFRRAAATRAPNGVVESPPFAPAAER